VRYAATTLPIAVAHRGGGSLALENTFDAFSMSHALGLRYLETDIRLTADGVPVLFHDVGTYRLNGVRQRIERSRLIDLPPWVPTLEAALLRFPDTCFTADIKHDAAALPVAEVLLRTGAAARVCVAGAWDGTLAQVADRVGVDLCTAMGWRALCRLVMCSRSRLPFIRHGRATFAHVPIRVGRLPIFADTLLARAHDIGVRVLVWTVNDVPTMTRLLDLGVDGLITDRPDLLREILIARGQWRTPVPGGSAANGQFASIVPRQDDAPQRHA
jgi:glycerophosphoryl diester phosphodiesterase